MRSRSLLLLLCAAAPIGRTTPQTSYSLLSSSGSGLLSDLLDFGSGGLIGGAMDLLDDVLGEAANSTSPTGDTNAAPVPPVSPSPHPATSETTYPPQLNPFPPHDAPAAPPASDSRQKHVFAHHMVGNTYSYTAATWVSDISLASSSGISGFALNLGPDTWQVDRISDAYSAAASADAGTPFSLFLSLDLSAIPCATAEHAGLVRDLISRLGQQPAQFRVDGKPMVSTFAGEACMFGMGSADEGWERMVKALLPFEIHFVPSFFVDPATFSTLSSSNGQLAWNSAWPSGDTVASLDVDSNYLNNLPNQTYVAGIAPCFFTHYGPDTYDKNWVYKTDDWHYATRWEQLISIRDRLDMVEIITWNDYGESSYIGPIGVDQPNSQSWVDGRDHTGWLPLTKYYAEAFITGQYPVVKDDSIVFWSRTHPANANAASDSVGRPDHANWLEDSAWIVVLASSPGKLTVTTSGGTSSTSLLPGANKVKTPLSDGSVQLVLERDGSIVLDWSPQGFQYTMQPALYNYNPFVAYVSTSH